MGAYEDFVKAFDAMPFSGKLNMNRKVNATRSHLEVDRGVSKLYWDGYLCATDKMAAVAGDGDYYVYLWRHAWGEPFYVGSGKGDRWKSKQGRCDEFYPHLDKADAVTYLVLCGVDSKTARLFERYVSVNLVEAGYDLVNGDNNPKRFPEQGRERLIKRCAETESHELTPAVQKAVVKILGDDPRCDHRITHEFLERYGAGYFTRKASVELKEEA
jgi:hypothetical protein